MRIRRRLGKWKRGIKNWIGEKRHGPDTRFVYDYRDLEDYMRVSYCSVRDVGLATRCMISERIVEYPLVFQKLARQPGLVLDIGSAESFLPYQIASLGHTVIASDLYPPNQEWRKRGSRADWTVHQGWGGYLFKHPKLHFVREDACQLGHADNHFDCATAISTVEHFGCYGVRVPDPVAMGMKAMAEIHRVLKPGGLLLMSVPYGRGGDSERNRLLQLVFDKVLLGKYLTQFKIVEQKFFVYEGCCWVEGDEMQAGVADCATRTMGMCFVEARKS